jgi:uncharacterized protein YfaS (alpha-2-macroglobulin family)
VTVDVRPAKRPVPNADGYHFGLAQETALASSRAVYERFTTNASGQAELQLDAGDTPVTTYPMEAVVRADIFDVGGRPIATEATVPLANLAVLIGVKPLFEDAGIPESGVASFDVAVFDPEGKALPRSLDYVIVKEEVRISVSSAAFGYPIAP